MLPPILVTGLMRSGTSPLAMTLHTKLGVQMGIHMLFPAMGPRNHVEWEDSEFQGYFMSKLMEPAGEYDGMADWLRAYADRRSAYAEATQQRRWGVKTPFALPWVPLIRELWPGVTVILTERPVEETFRSLEQQSQGHPAVTLEVATAIQRSLLPFRKNVYADVVLHHADIVKDDLRLDLLRSVVEG